MSETKHTPGPWRWIDDECGSGSLFADQPGTPAVAFACGNDVVCHSADRALIAAAPLLLAACRAAACRPHDPATLRQVEAAIDAAEGRAGKDGA